MITSILNKQNLGRMRMSYELLDKILDDKLEKKIYQDIMSKCIILRTDVDYFSKIIEYTFYCEDLRKLSDGEMIPMYLIKVTSYKNTLNNEIIIESKFEEQKREYLNYEDTFVCFRNPELKIEEEKIKMEKEFMDKFSIHPCFECHGKGIIHDKECPSCNGDKYIINSKIIKE